MGVHGDQMCAVADVAKNIPHRIDFDFVKTDLFHLLLDPQNHLFFLAAFTGNRDHVPQKPGHVWFVLFRQPQDFVKLDVQFFSSFHILVQRGTSRSLRSGRRNEHG